MANIPGASVLRGAGEALAEGKGGITSTADQVEEFLQLGGRYMGASFAAGSGEADILAAESAGAAVAGVSLWTILVVLLIIVFVLRIVENLLKKFGNAIPGILGGGAITSLINWEFGVLDSVENAILNKLLQVGRSILHDFQLLVFFVLGVDPVALSRLLSGSGTAGNSAATQGQIKVLQAEIDYLNKRLATVQGQITAPGSGTTTLPSPTPVPVSTPGTVTVTSVPPAVWQQIHNLEAEYSAIRHDLTDFDTRLRTVTHTVNSVELQLQALAHQVHDVRAVAVGWQDIAQEVEQLGTALSSFVNVTQADLSEIHHHQAQMAPLGLLLQPGIAGLKNLRKLEDNPCGCPKIPGMPRLKPELLAMYEFMTHG